MRKINWRATISFLNAFPIWAMPNGIFMRPDFCTFKKLTKIPWAVSGRKYMVLASPATDPSSVENIRLNWRTSVQFLEPEIGQTISRSRMSCRTPSRSFCSSAFFMRSSICAIFSWLRKTFGLVALNCSASKASPKRFWPFSTSFSIFWRIFSMWSSKRTSAR